MGEVEFFWILFVLVKVECKRMFWRILLYIVLFGIMLVFCLVVLVVVFILRMGIKVLEDVVFIEFFFMKDNWNIFDIFEMWNFNCFNFLFEVNKKCLGVVFSKEDVEFFEGLVSYKFLEMNFDIIVFIKIGWMFEKVCVYMGFVVVCKFC